MSTFQLMSFAIQSVGFLLWLVVLSLPLPDSSFLSFPLPLVLLLLPMDSPSLPQYFNTDKTDQSKGR